MADDLFGSIRDITSRVETAVNEASQPAATPAPEITSGGISDLSNQLEVEVAKNMDLFMQTFSKQQDPFDPATAFKPGEVELNAMKREGQLSAFINQAVQSGEKLEPALAKMLPDTKNNVALQGSFDQILQGLLTQNKSASDDFVRDFVQNAMLNPESLNSAPKSLLQELKLVLLAGDEPDLNAPFIEVLDSAYKSSTVA